MVHMTNYISNTTVMLTRKFNEGLSKAGKSADTESINNAIRIFKNTKRVYWDHEILEKWQKFGLHYVYLATQAIDAELEPLLELVQIDKHIGYSCLKEHVATLIFRFKSLKIIDKTEVGNCQSDQKLKYNLRVGTSGTLLMMTIW